MDLLDCAHRSTNTLSGGQKQRAAIAGALAQNPKVGIDIQERPLCLRVLSPLRACDTPFKVGTGTRKDTFRKFSSHFHSTPFRLHEYSSASWAEMRCGTWLTEAWHRLQSCERRFVQAHSVQVSHELFQ